MNKREIRRFIERLTERFRGEDLQRTKLIGVCVLLGVAVLCLAISVAPMFRPHRRAQEPRSPGWTLVRELNEALVAKDAFSDTGFVVESEKPLKLRLTGAVRTEQDLKDLREYIRQIGSDAPADQFEIDVQIMK